VLIARGHTRVGRSGLRWAVLFTPGLWSVVAERDGLTLGVRPFTFAAAGRPFTVIELHLRPEDVTVAPAAAPVPLDLDAATWEAAAAVARLAPSDDALRSDFAALIERVAALGLVAAAMAARALLGPPRAFSLLWRGLRPMIERFYLTPTLQELGDATGISVRQVDRHVQELIGTFALVGPGWRAATRHLRQIRDASSAPLSANPSPVPGTRARIRYPAAPPPAARRSETLMYEIAVVQTKKMLNNVERWLDTAVAHAQKKSFDPETLLHARLAPDQYPLARQIQAACDAAKHLAAFLAGKAPPKHPDTEKTLADVRARIHTVTAYLDTFKEGDFADAATRRIELPFAEGKVILGADYLRELGVPNFYFHVTTVYAILRHNGVDLGKRDYIGGIPLRDK
jgi:hypothetical protein